MKVKVLVRNGNVVEAVMEMDRLPKEGDCLQVARVGRVRVVNSLKVKPTLEYEARVVAERIPRPKRK